MVYVPYYLNGQCAVIYNSDIIRVYETRPVANNQYYAYVDYYYNSHYSFNTGSQYFGVNYSVPSCRNDITTDIYYRNDFDSVLIVFLILAFIICWLPWKLFSILFRK